MGDEREGGIQAHSQVYQTRPARRFVSPPVTVTLGRKAGLGYKKVSSELDMLSSRCLWNTGGKECGWLELHGRGSLMSMYGACLEMCGWNRT